MEVPLYQIKYVTLDSLQKAFALNELWSKDLKTDDPENETSLIKFLNITCKYEQEGLEEPAYDIINLHCIAMLWCDGEANEKVVELFDLLQDNNQ